MCSTLNLLLFACVCFICINVGITYHNVCVEVRGQVSEVPFLSTVGPWDQNQTVRPLQQAFYWLTYLADLLFSVLR